MSETPWLDTQEEDAWRALQFMNMRLTTELARDLARHSDLAYQDYVVLVALTDQPDGMLRLYELAERLGWERSRLSHHISRMAGRGLIEKRKCPSDRRGALVVATDHGRSVIGSAAPSHAAAVRRFFIDLLTPAQLASLADAANTVLAALGSQAGQD